MIVLNEFENLFIDGDHFPLDNDASVSAVTFKDSKVNFIPAAILLKFRNLNHLILRKVSLQALNEHSLDNCERLKNLDLEANEIRELHTGVFRHCLTLQTLRLGYNKISVVELNAFDGLHKLFYLDLQNNLMQELPPTTLYPLPSLVTFLVGSPGLTEIHSETFINTNLSALHIYGSPITEFPRNTFRSQGKLNRLTVYETMLSKILPGTFQNLKSLRFLMLHVGRLTEIDAMTLSGLTELVEIDVKWNRIERIHPNAFVDNVNLEYFYVGNNNLKTLSGRLLVNNPNLKYMDVANNRLEAIERNFFDSHETSLRYLTASDNACIDRDFQQFANFSVQVLPYFKRCFRKFEELFPANP